MTTTANPELKACDRTDWFEVKHDPSAQVIMDTDKKTLMLSLAIWETMLNTWKPDIATGPKWKSLFSFDEFLRGVLSSRPAPSCAVQGVVAALKAETKKRCTYCRDDREVIERDGGKWHRIARGGDLGDTEPCNAAQMQIAIDILRGVKS